MTADQAAVRQATHENRVQVLTQILQAIVAECEPTPARLPFSADSYLPLQLLSLARAAIAKATGDR